MICGIVRCLLSLRMRIRGFGEDGSSLALYRLRLLWLDRLLSLRDLPLLLLLLNRRESLLIQDKVVIEVVVRAVHEQLQPYHNQWKRSIEEEHW